MLQAVRAVLGKQIGGLCLVSWKPLPLPSSPFLQLALPRTLPVLSSLARQWARAPKVAYTVQPTFRKPRPCHAGQKPRNWVDFWIIIVLFVTKIKLGWIRDMNTWLGSHCPATCFLFLKQLPTFYSMPMEENITLPSRLGSSSHAGKDKSS